MKIKTTKSLFVDIYKSGTKLRLDGWEAVMTRFQSSHRVLSDPLLVNVSTGESWEIRHNPYHFQKFLDKQEVKQVSWLGPENKWINITDNIKNKNYEVTVVEYADLQLYVSDRFELQEQASKGVWTDLGEYQLCLMNGTLGLICMYGHPPVNYTGVDLTRPPAAERGTSFCGNVVTTKEGDKRFPVSDQELLVLIPGSVRIKRVLRAGEIEEPNPGIKAWKYQIFDCCLDDES